MRIIPIPNIKVLDVFKPNPGGQEQFFKSNKPQIIFAGGNKSGKTYSGVIKSAYRSIAEYDIRGNKTGYLRDPYHRIRLPVGRKIQGWISTYSQSTQKETIQPIIELVFSPFIVGTPIYERGCMIQFSTEDADIHFKWQTQGSLSYTGANVDWIFMDEPHDRSIYNECIGRTLKSKGHIWICLTPIIDTNDADFGTKIRYIKWMIDDIVNKIDSLPNVELIYVNTEENPHVDIEFFNSQMLAMSDYERHIRKTGEFLITIGNTLVNGTKMSEVLRYMTNKHDECQPDYVALHFDDKEEPPRQVVPELLAIRDFPLYPKDKDGFVWKIWEYPIDPEISFRPKYVIGCDSATRTGDDYTCAYIKRVDNGKTVACLHGIIEDENGELAKQLWLAGMLYGEYSTLGDWVPAKLALEINSYGRTTLSYLTYGNSDLGVPKYSLSRMYKRPSRQDMRIGRVTPTDNVGWITDKSTRTFLIASIVELFEKQYLAMINKEPLPMPDICWAKELQQFVLTQSGKYEASPTSSDDRLIASAICDQVIKQEGRLTTSLYVPQQQKITDAPFLYDNGKVIINGDYFVKKQKPTKSWY